MYTAPDRQGFVEHIASLTPKNSICIEVGTYRGDFSEMILKNIKPFQLFLVDTWEVDDKYEYAHEILAQPITGREEDQTKGMPTSYSTNDDLEIVKEKFSDEIIKNQVILKKGFSYDVVNEFPDDFFDFIYIDACHLYECVRDDLKMFLPKLKKNGLMCGHDYMDFRGFAIGSDFGVVRAVDEFVVDNDFKWVATTMPNFSMIQIPDFALKRP